MAVNSYVPDMPQGQQPVNSTQPLFLIILAILVRYLVLIMLVLM